MESKSKEYRRTRFVISYFDNKKLRNDKEDKWEIIREVTTIAEDDEQKYSFIKSKRLFKHLDDNL